jgi:dTDP-4-dehydrorhamnose 3,5-epimerase
VIFTETAVDGARIVDLDRRGDDRGFFARSYCVDELRAEGIEMTTVQCNLSWNGAKGTLRGMHYQDASAPEPKLVRCTRGAIWDVIVDVRPDSPTYRRHVAVELTAENRRQLYVPPVCAHGYLTLADDTEVVYQVGGMYTPSAERGLRYDDPVLGLPWPVAVEVISPKDAAWPLLELVEERR